MAKKTTTKKPATPVAPEHTTLVPLRKKQVRLIADPGYMIRSRHTGHVFHEHITVNLAAWEVIKEGEDSPAEGETF